MWKSGNQEWSSEGFSLELRKSGTDDLQHKYANVAWNSSTLREQRDPTSTAYAFTYIPLRSSRPLREAHSVYQPRALRD